MRDLSRTLPSPSELDCWNTCQFKWVMEWRNGVRSASQHTAMLMGRAVSDAVGHAFRGNSVDEAMNVFGMCLQEMVDRKEAVEDQKWLQEKALTIGVLNAYFANFSPERFGAVVGVQVDLRPPQFPIHVKMDLVSRTERGRIRIVDQKLISGFADIQHENLKYEMGSQPSLYAVLGELNGWDVEEFVIDYLIKGKAAYGRYKETPPSLDTHAFPVEGWKKDLAMISAHEANAGMVMVMEQLVGQEGQVEMARFPRRVVNCIRHWGNKDYPCDFYVACAANLSPLAMPEQFKQERR